MTKILPKKHKCGRCGTEYETLEIYSISPFLPRPDINNIENENKCPNCGKLYSEDVNMKNYTPHEWYEFAKNLHDLIIVELNNASGSEFLSQVYPKLIIMYEFFRLIRGEAFNSSRPYGLGELQKEIYKMEEDISKRLKDVENKLDPNDESAKFSLESMKKLFNLMPQK